MNRQVMLGAALALTTVLSGAALGQIYRTTDADGNVIFTDTPPPGGAAEQVQLQQTNRAEPTRLPPPDAADQAEETTALEATPAQVVRITSPANEETIPMGGGNFSVTARVEPPLEKGQSLRLSLDGTPTGKLQQSGFWDLVSVERGAHDLSVAVVDANGKVLTNSDPVRVYVMRPSLNNPPP